MAYELGGRGRHVQLFKVFLERDTLGAAWFICSRYFRDETVAGFVGHPDDSTGSFIKRTS
jgi:hypothetical protein